MTHQSGRHFLQLQGSTSTPLPVLDAIAKPTIDRREPGFEKPVLHVLSGTQPSFETISPEIVYPVSVVAAREAALVSPLSVGGKVLMFETRWFASLCHGITAHFDIDTEFIKGRLRSDVNANTVVRLCEDRAHEIMAFAVVHNEASTGATSDIAAVPRAIDDAGRPALLLVDAISSLGSIDYRHDEGGADVAVGGSQQGPMLPPGRRSQRCPTRPRPHRCWGPSGVEVGLKARRIPCRAGGAEGATHDLAGNAGAVAEAA